MPATCRLRAGSLELLQLLLQLLLRLSGAAFGGRPLGHARFAPFVWRDDPPADVPFARSELFAAVEFTGRSAAPGGHADTWYPTWAADGLLYTPWTDGTVNGVSAASGCATPGCLSTTGFATIAGDDPFNLTVQQVGTVASSPSPYHGRYPCGTLYYKGVWFYGTYALDGDLLPDHRASAGSSRPDYCGNWCVQGPFVGFRWSTDGGKSWVEPRVRMGSFEDNIFGESAPDNRTRKVKFGAPHVVDLGRELEHMPEGDVQPMMYVVGHGASRAESPTSWVQGSEVYLARVEPSIAAVQNRSRWEFFAGGGRWVRGEVAGARPLLSWPNRTGVTTMTFVPAIGRYIMCVSTPTFSPFTTRQFDTYLLEGEAITGPFRLITYMREFGPQAYFVNIPSKFAAPALDADGSLRLFLGYSANFAFAGEARPPGGGYHWTLQEVRLRPTALAEPAAVRA